MGTAELHDAVVSLLVNADRRRQLGGLGRAEASERFAAAVVGRRGRELYEAVAGTSAGRLT
jgi:hypothetical protein